MLAEHFFPPCFALSSSIWFIELSSLSAALFPFIATDSIARHGTSLMIISRGYLKVKCPRDPLVGHLGFHSSSFLYNTNGPPAGPIF